MRFEHRVRETTRRTRGAGLAQIVEDLSHYLLRAVARKHWKRGPNRFAELRRRGIGRDLAAQSAGSPHGPWRMSDSPALAMALHNAHLKALGLPCIAPARSA